MLSRARVTKVLPAVSGVVAALVALELTLRTLVTPALPPLPRIAADSLDAPVVAANQIEEGIGRAHYTIAGARLTGRQPDANEPVVVILGDSHVAAREVRDEETMGAWVERLALEARQPLTVRQYGWRGASPAQYLLVASEVRRRWHPERVVIVLSRDDLDDHVLAGQYPRLKVRRDSSLIVVRGGTSASDDREGGIAAQSALARLAVRRWERLVSRAPRGFRDALGVQGGGWNARPSREMQVLPWAVVRALGAAYGASLSIVYAAEVRVTGGGGDEVDPVERAFLDACTREVVECVSARSAMLEAKHRGEIARGFATTTLGVGHLNPVGHRLMGSIIWQLVPRRVRPRVAER